MVRGKVIKFKFKMDIGKSVSNLTADSMHHSISVLVNDSIINTVVGRLYNLVGDLTYDPVYNSASIINDSTL